MAVSASEFKKAPTTSICSISRSNSAARATASFQVTFLHTPANVWSKSFPYFCLKPLTTHLALRFKILPSLSLLVLRTSFPGNTLQPFGSFERRIILQVLLYTRHRYSFLIAFFHSGQSGLFFASSIVWGSL